jgi:hypothetical protein
LKLERIIKTELNESSVCERLATYFALAGYKQAISQPHLMTYQRGKFLTLTAKGCKVNAIIQISPSPDQTIQVTVTLDIDTTGQFVVERERKYWRKEIDDIEEAILKGKGN